MPTAPPLLDERRPTRRGTEARAALVAAAERCFAERGVDAVSLRDVSAAAGQRNHSAAQYHFGDRAGLVAAVYLAHMERVDARRRALLAEVEAEGATADVARLVHCAVLPLVEEVTASEGWYARFLLRTRWDATAIEVVAGLEATPGLRALGHHLVRRLGPLPPARRRSRLDQVFHLVVSTLADWEWAHDRDQPRLSADALVAELTATGAAVLLAPATPA